MTSMEPQAGRFQARMLRSTKRLFVWTAVWLTATALLALGPEFLWNESPAITGMFTILTLGAGLAMILANKTYLQQLDELQRKVQLDAMGITLGVVVIVGSPYMLLEIHDMAPFEASFAHLLVLMSFTYMASNFIGLRRYR